MLVKIWQKNEFSETVCPAHWALFIFISTYSFETVKQLDYNWYSHLTRRFSGKAAALGARGTGFNFWLWQVPGSIFGCSFVWFFVLLLLCFYFLSKIHYLSQNFAIPFEMSIYSVYLTYCKIGDRLLGYKDTHLARGPVYMWLLI